MRRYFGIGLLVLASACAGPTPRYTPTNIAPPATPPGVAAPAPIEKRAEPVNVPSPPEPGKKVTLTRDGAILTAVLNNRGIDVARFGPQISETLAPEARAAFDPLLLANVTASHNEYLSRLTGTGSSNALAGTGSGSGTSTPLQAFGTSLTRLQSALAPFVSTDSLLKSDSVSGSTTVQELFPTGTQLSVSGTANSEETNLSGDTHNAGVSVTLDQPLLQGAGIPVNLVALRQAKNRATQSEYVFKNSVLTVISLVEQAYWNQVLNVEVLKIRQVAVSLADEQLNRVDAQLSVGRAIEGDVMAARAEKATRTADLTDAEAAIRKQNTQLIQLLNPDGAEQWRIEFEPSDRPDVTPVNVNLDESQKLALAFRPELAEAKLDIANFDLDLFRAKNNLLPRLDIVGSYSKNTLNNSGGATSSVGSVNGADSESLSIGAQFQYPIMNRAARARYHRAKLTNTQAERNLANLEQGIVSDARTAVIEVQRQSDRIIATHEAVQARAEQLRVAQGRFDVGKTTNLDLLLVQRDLIQSQVDSITAEVRFAQALASLFTTEGTLLERRGISLDLAKKENEAQEKQ